MGGTEILISLLGSVALLLWGLHMVHSGIVRAFGSDLRRFLGMALRNRFLAFVAGIFDGAPPPWPVVAGGTFCSMPGRLTDAVVAAGSL